MAETVNENVPREYWTKSPEQQTQVLKEQLQIHENGCGGPVFHFVGCHQNEMTILPKWTTKSER